MRTIAIVNQKGGVGKTTTAVNLSHALVLLGHSVTSIDMDPQGHMAISLQLSDETIPGVDQVLFEQQSIMELSREIHPHWRVVPPGPKLAEVEQRRPQGKEIGWALATALSQYQQTQNIAKNSQNPGDGTFFTILDCPPSWGFLTINALLAASELVIPISADYLSLQGFSRMFRIVRYIERHLHLNLTKWILITRYDKQRPGAQSIYQVIHQHVGKRVLQTVIRETPALAVAPSVGKTIFEYDPGSDGAEDYHQLALDLQWGRTQK